MALYEYQCQQCGARNEVLQKMADPRLTTCEVCGGALKRLHSTASMQFKGSGWYVTDYARKGAGAGSDAPKSEAGGGESKGDSSAGEAKPAGESKPAASSTGGSGGSDSGSSSASSSGSSSSSGSGSESGSGSG